MFATPLIPGHLYHVHGAGLYLEVIAPNPFAAISIAVGLLEGA